MAGLLINSCKLTNTIFQLGAQGLTRWCTRNPSGSSPEPYSQGTGVGSLSMETDSQTEAPVVFVHLKSLGRLALSGG